jgi:UPF0716 family protein affecting phage T7 exclusion
MLLHQVIEVAGLVVVTSAVLTSLIAIWSLLPRPRRVFQGRGTHRGVS